MAAGNPPRQGQAEPGAVAGGRSALTRGVTTIKAPENVGSDLVRYSGPLIADRNHIAVRGAIEIDVHRASSRGVPYGVVDQVADHPVNQLLVPVKGRRTNGQGVLDGDAPGRRDYPGRPHDILDHFVEVHR